MSVQERSYTITEFAEYVAHPENIDRLWELVNGEIIEVSPGRTHNSGMRDLIAVAVHNFCREHQIPCYTSGEAGAYTVGEGVLVPDFAYKHTPLSNDYPDPVAPEWAVEIVSPTDKAPAIRNKREIYRKAGILYWEIYPEAGSVDVYAPHQPMRTFGMNDTLDGGNVLPGFRLAVRDILGS